MLPQFLDWGALSENVSQVSFDVKSKIEQETKKRYILIAAGFVGAFIFLLAIKGR